MLQPSAVHLCISRRCTAEKCILRAPLSQNVLRQTLHCTLFLPVTGLIREVPIFIGFQERFGGVGGPLPSLEFKVMPHGPTPNGVETGESVVVVVDRFKAAEDVDEESSSSLC